MKIKEEKHMTPKELLYIEDALGHEKQMKDSCTDFAVQLQDGELKNFVQGLCAKHQNSFDKFYGLLSK
ncbi:MAG: hypothetical protein ACI4RV_01650 [Eubacteriales bacterium]